MRRLCVVLALMAFAGKGSTAWQSAATNPFRVFGEAAELSAEDLRDLRAGRTIVRMLPASGRFDVGVFVATRIDVSRERFVARMQDTASLWKGEAVPATGMFSKPAVVGDVADLTLPRKDTDGLRDCRPGDCLVKLTTPEIERMRAAIAQHGSNWREAVEREFRQIVVDRIEAYRKGGAAALPPLNDHSAPVAPETTFSRLFAATRALPAYVPHVAAYLEKYPHAPLPAGATEHFYWLLTTETPRPTVQVMHVVVQPQPAGEHLEALVVSRQVLASHYVNGAVAITALIRDPADSRQYLVYVNRSEVDGLGGVFSGIRRFFVERRIRGAARGAVERLKQRIAS